MTSDPKASRTALVVLLRAKRSGMSASEKAKRKKPAKWLYPWATEHRYAQSYRAWVKPVREFVHQFLAKHQEAILNGDSKDAVIRTDAVAGESFALMVQSLNGWVTAYISDDEDKKLQSPIYMGLGDIADSAFDFNGRQYDKSMKSAIGISFPDDESWWPEARKMWQDSNYETIRSDIKKYIADINTATEQAVTNGWSVKALADKIIALDTKITKSRANFIARDQIGKLNGTITQKRMQDAGLSMYVWDTSGDERVRESHAVMEGLLCRWDDATVCSYDGGRTWVPRPAGAVLMHPGMDYQCRCCADAYFNELLDEADGVSINEGFVETAENPSTMIKPKKEPKKPKEKDVQKPVTQNTFTLMSEAEYQSAVEKSAKSISAYDVAQIDEHEFGGRQRGYVRTANSRVINTTLRDKGVKGLDDEDRKTYDALRGAISKNKLEKDTVLIRNLKPKWIEGNFGIKGDYGLDRFYDISSNSEVIKQIEALKGKSFTENQFLSCSTDADKNYMKGYGVTLELRVPKDTNCFFPNNPNESEVILDVGHKLNIINVEVKSERVYMICELVK